MRHLTEAAHMTEGVASHKTLCMPKVQDTAAREPTAGACFPLVRMARDVFLDFVMLCNIERLTLSLIEAAPNVLRVRFTL